MAHSEATRRAPVFRSAATTSAKLHAVDARTFPDPRFATRARTRTPPTRTSPRRSNAKQSTRANGTERAFRTEFQPETAFQNAPKLRLCFTRGRTCCGTRSCRSRAPGWIDRRFAGSSRRATLATNWTRRRFADPSPRRNRDASRRSIVDRLMRRRPRSIPARTFPFPTRFAPCARATRRLRFSARDRRRPPSTETSPVFFRRALAGVRVFGLRRGYLRPDGSPVRRGGRRGTFSATAVRVDQPHTRGPPRRRRHRLGETKRTVGGARRARGETAARRRTATPSTISRRVRRRGTPRVRIRGLSRRARRGVGPVGPRRERRRDDSRVGETIGDSGIR